MRVLMVLLFTVMGLIVGVATTVAIIATCNTVHKPPQDGSQDWVGWAGLALLVLGPLAGGIVGFVVALRKGRQPQ